MRKWNRFLAVIALGLFMASAATADTLELKDGRVLKGKYLGGTQVVLRFEINGEVQTFNTTDIVALTFTGRPAASAPAPAPTPAAALAPAPAAAAPDPSPGGTMTIPAGQSLLVRMIDGVDSSKNHVGDVFHASLETDLTIGNTVVARKGTDVYGRLAEAKEAGHISGSSELHRQESWWWRGSRRHYRCDCRRRQRRGNRCGRGLGGWRWRPGLDERPAGEGAERDVAGIPPATTGNGGGNPRVGLIPAARKRKYGRGFRKGLASPFSLPVASRFESASRPRLLQRCRIGTIRLKFPLATPTVSE